MAIFSGLNIASKTPLWSVVLDADKQDRRNYLQTQVLTKLRVSQIRSLKCFDKRVL